MKGYVAAKRSRYYAVIYEGLDAVTGREGRSWHPAGHDRADAEKLARRLAAQHTGRNDQTWSLNFGAYLTRQWLPGKRVVLAASTYAGYHRNVHRHILPNLGRVGLRQLRPDHLDALYDRLLHPANGVGLAPKTVYEVHLVIRGALTDAVRRGLLSRNVALVAHAPRLRAVPKVEQQAWTADELKVFLRAAAGHRLFPAVWVAAVTGMRRNELLGLRWDDFDAAKATLSINRGLIAIGWGRTAGSGAARASGAGAAADWAPTVYGPRHARCDLPAFVMPALGACSSGTTSDAVSPSR